MQCIDLIVPAVDDRVAVEIMDELHDALFQLVFRADADVTEHGAGGFGEEPLDEIEPEACLGVNTNRKRPSGRAASQALVSCETCAE